MRLLALAALLFTACAASFTNLTTPTTLAPGQGEVYFAPTGVGVASLPAGRGRTSAALLPNFEAGYRWGQDEGRDLGIHAWVAGAGTDIKVRLVDGGFSLAVDPGIALGMQSLPLGDQLLVTPAASLRLPLLAGLKLGDRVELVAAPQAAGMVALAPPIFFAGGSTGVRVRLAQRVSAMAEVVALRTFVVGEHAAFWTVQGAVAILVERATEPVRSPPASAGPRE